MKLDQRFVFIIGAPLSGTTWLQAMIGAHPLVCTSDELKVFDLFTGPWENSWELLIQLQKTGGGGPRGLRTIWSDDEFYRFLRAFLERLYRRVLAKKPNAAVILDKTPGYSDHVEHIARLIPQARFIHLVRDGRDVAASLHAASQDWGRLWAPSRIESAAHLWKHTLLDARKAKQFGESRYLELRYEDLLNKGAPVLLEAFRFIGVETTMQQTESLYSEHTFEKMKNQGAGVQAFDLPKGFFRKGQTGDWRNHFSSRERYLFHETAGDLLCQLGYAHGSWWIQIPYQRYLIPMIVLFSASWRLRKKASETVQRIMGPAIASWLRGAKARLAGNKRRPASTVAKVSP